MWVGGGPARRLRFWLALRGSPPGRRVVPVIGFLEGFVVEITRREAV
jgi:hypothetical protein